LLAGKRNKQIKLAEANVKLAQYQFFDLLRTLKYTLRSDFFHIYYLQQSAKVYDKEIKALQQIVDAYEKQTGKGYIAEKEVVLIKAQLYAFTSEYNDLVNQINDTESELRQILQAKPTTYITPEISTASVASLDPGKYPLAALLDSAHANRTDLLIAKANTDINKRNYDLQKALAVPDLTVSLGYDEQGSYAQNFNSVGASIDLPFFNRNQGNIKSAKAMIAVTDFTQKNVEVTVDETVTRALEKAFAQHNLYKKIDPTFESEFEKLTNEVIKNYMVRNIGLLDFLTFYDSYKQNALQLNNIQYNRVQALEDINFYTATNFFN
jgi:cobalt-zinc-cadmium efflux system outer membrane protein